MMAAGRFLPNEGIVPLSDVPQLAVSELRQCVLADIDDGARLVALFGCPSNATLRLFAVLAHQYLGQLSVASTKVTGSYPALTPECPEAHLFEREIYEQWGVEPTGHPWLKPVRFESRRKWEGARPHAANQSAVCGEIDFFQVEGEEVHEVAVGPVHAGVIEPGHFRFQCHGETVQHLEISLGYQHRGIEDAVVRDSGKRTLHYMETLAGDTTIGHTTAYCRNVEALTGTDLSARAEAIRGIALELERMANHIGDLGALAGDIGFLPTLSYCGRIRGDLLNLTALLCGNRFGRSLIHPGGVNYDVDEEIAEIMRERLQSIWRDAKSAVDLLWRSSSVLARFEGVGALDSDTAQAIGLVGVAARACGLPRDVRQSFPYGIYKKAHIPMAIGQNGDVMARALVRWQEIEHSTAFVLDQLDSLPSGSPSVRIGKFPQESHLAVSLVEGWRGEICHVALTRQADHYQGYKVIDPSFHNWFGLALALRNQQISDFPLCNKSFNLSYCGHDL
ncbi:NADH-quinone oxidoreductase subunit C [Candidatus Bipolaricaulota bacterium]|nr:NADH-quinone oxidoreductase subunit C [Candidatus Bipolaricaulota bacterium]